MLKRNLAVFLMSGVLLAGAATVPVSAQPPALHPSMYSGTHLKTGEIINGELLATHPKMEDGSHADCFHLNTVEGQRYQVTLRSSDFDSYLMMGIGDCADIMLSMENDDFEETTLDSRITFIAQHALYSIFVNSYDPGFTGVFTLQVE
jgi:hypothetical protein